MNHTFLNRLNDVILRPKIFFEEMEVTGGFKDPLLFSLFVFFPVTILGFVLYLLGMPQMIVIADVTKEMGSNQLSVIFFLRCAAWICGLFLMTSLYHIGFKVVGGTGSYESTFRIVAFTSATYIFNLIPRIGIFVYCFYSLYLIIVGGGIVHKIPLAKSIIGPLIPVFFVMIISACLQIFKN